MISISFLRCAVTVIFLGTYFAPVQGQAQEAKKILHMPPNKIVDFAVKTAGDKRIIAIYTSWCPACRKIMPKVMDIENIKPGSVIAISEDEDHVQFSRYIEKYPKIPFMIFLSKPKGNITLPAMFEKKLGAKPWTGYPHFILLDGENKIVSEGNFEADALADFILGTGEMFTK